MLSSPRPSPCRPIPPALRRRSSKPTATLDPDFLPLEALPFADTTVVPDDPDTTAFLSSIVFDGPAHPFEQPDDWPAGPADQLEATAAVNPVLRFSAPTPFDKPFEDGVEAHISEDAAAPNVDIDSTHIIEDQRFDTLPFGKELHIEDDSPA